MEMSERLRGWYWLLWLLAIGVSLFVLMVTMSVPESQVQDPIFDFTEDDYRQVNLDNESFIQGASFGEWPDSDNERAKQFEEDTGVQPDVVGLFVNWTMPFGYVQPNVTGVAQNGAVPMITWAPHGSTTPDIVDGDKELYQADGEKVTIDEYIDSWARGVCHVAEETGQPILLRPMHEMNGGWFTWGTSWQAPDGSHPNSPESFKEAWRKIHDAFRDVCSSEHVRFVWTTNQASVGEGTSFMGSYPGDAHVDYVGIDGYNWGAHASWGWRSFEDIFKDAYCAVTDKTDVPIILPEWGSVEKGGNKSEWIREAFEGIQSGKYSQIQGAVWLEVTKYERETDSRVAWSVDSSPEALNAYSQNLQTLEEDGVGTSEQDVCEG